MSDKLDKTKNRFLSSGRDIHGRLQAAGKQVAKSSVSIRELEPDWDAAKVKRHQSLHQSNKVVYALRRIAFAASLIGFAAWFFISWNSDVAHTLSNGSETKADAVAVDDVNSSARKVNTGLADRFLAALATKRRIPLESTMFKKFLNQPNDLNSDPRSKTSTEQSIQSLIQPRRISLDELSSRLPSFEKLPIPKIRLQLVLSEP